MTSVKSVNYMDDGAGRLADIMFDGVSHDGEGREELCYEAMIVSTRGGKMDSVV